MYLCTCVCMCITCTIAYSSTDPWAQCPLTSSLGEFPKYWDWLWYPGLSPRHFARVGVHHLSLCLPYLGVFPFTLHLPLDFIRVFPLRSTYLHPFGRPFTYSLSR